MPPKNDITPVWDQIVEQVKLDVIRPTLWRSMEAAVPITMEDGEFVVGFAPGTYHMSGNLTSGDHLNAIENAIRKFTGSDLRLRIIEGDSAEDWVYAKSKDQHILEIRERARVQREKEAGQTHSWESLLDQIGRRYVAVPLRQLPQNKARYVFEALNLISETMDELMPNGAEVDELTQRSLARAIDKVSQLSDIPSPVLALELFRLRGYTTVPEK